MKQSDILMNTLITYWYYWYRQKQEAECLKKEFHPQTLLFLVKVQQMSETFEWALYRTHPDRWQHQKHHIDSSRQNKRGVDVLAPPQQAGVFQMLFRGTVSLKTGQFQSEPTVAQTRRQRLFKNTNLLWAEPVCTPIPQTPPEDDRSTVGPAAVCVFIKHSQPRRVSNYSFISSISATLRLHM